MYKKRSQMEIMGLAIIVILISLSLIFVVRFVVLKEPTDFKKAFTQTELASNMLNTFLKTTSEDCSGLSMTELLQDCAQGGGITCGNGERSCIYVNQTAEQIFRDTLYSWNVDYYFSVYQDESSPIFTLPEPGKPCIGAKKSKLFAIPTGGATLFVKMDICG